MRDAQSSASNIWLAPFARFGKSVDEVNERVQPGVSILSDDAAGGRRDETGQ